MSDAIAMPPIGETEAKHTPTVYFIDDSATMREVIKIAFRRENIHVITCADATSALAQFEEHPPDVVITDVIMPDQDGYSVCSQIKQNPQYEKTPVILMSGVVNKSVADRAVAVQADDLVRKPFQPQELIGRVKHLLAPAMPQPATPPADRPVAVPSLSSLFAPPCTGSARYADSYGAGERAAAGRVSTGRTGLAACRGGSIHGTEPGAHRAANSRADGASSRARGRAIGRAQAARGNRAPGTAGQETADRTANRAPV